MGEYADETAIRSRAREQLMEDELTKGIICMSGLFDLPEQRVAKPIGYL